MSGSSKAEERTTKKDRIVTRSEVAQVLGQKTLIVAILVFILFIGLMSVSDVELYSYVKQNLEMQGENTAVRFADEYSKYLLVGTDTLKVSGYTVNNLIRKNASNEDILQYMTEETIRFQETIDSEYTGLYGWINGVYLDGSGWVPDGDYVPTQRPWYLETQESESEVTLTNPYIDMDTGGVVVTITDKLVDGVSVLAMDVRIDRLQEIAQEEAQESNGVTIGMVISSDAIVAAHSDQEEIGKDYLNEEGTLGAEIAHRTLEDGEHTFTVDYAGTSWLIYAKEIEGGWYGISAIDTGEYYKPLRWVVFGSFTVAAIIALVLFFIFKRIGTDSVLNARMNTQLSALTYIYEYMTDIDLEEDTYSLIRAGDSSKTMNDVNEDAQAWLFHIADDLTAPTSREPLREFVDLSTINERLRDKITITCEYQDIKRVWNRARFVVSDKDENGKILRLLCLSESIDQEKRQREEFRILSETDLMTGILNHGSGEQKIIEALDKGRGGMFIILDIDKFKSINDTFGHRIGDKALIAVADCIKRSFRKEDIVMRLGGDEFAAMACDIATEAEGKKILSHLLYSLEKVHIEEMGDTPFYVSIGVAFFDAKDKLTFDELYQKTDICTYKAKNMEGNQIVFSE